MMMHHAPKRKKNISLFPRRSAMRIVGCSITSPNAGQIALLETGQVSRRVCPHPRIGVRAVGQEAGEAPLLLSGLARQLAQSF